MAGLEGIDASTMDLIDALGAVKFVYDAGDRVAKPVLRHTDFAPVARNEQNERIVEKVRFGLPMMQGRSIRASGPEQAGHVAARAAPRIITNARDDKLTSSPSWKSMLGKPENHGLAAISYVVERDAKGNAFRIQRRDGGLIVVPALVARRHYKFASTGNEYDDLGHVQITGDSNEFVGTIHDRFVIELGTKKERDAWMAPDPDDRDALVKLLKPAPNDRYEMVPIDADVWTKRNAEAVKPRGEAIRWKA